MEFFVFGCIIHGNETNGNKTIESQITCPGILPKDSVWVRNFVHGAVHNYFW